MLDITLNAVLLEISLSFLVKDLSHLVDRMGELALNVHLTHCKVFSDQLDSAEEALQFFSLRHRLLFLDWAISADRFAKGEAFEDVVHEELLTFQSNSVRLHPVQVERLFRTALIAKFLGTLIS